LDVAFAYDAQVADALGGQVDEQIDLILVERASGSDHDGFTRVDTQRVDVFHIGHREAVVIFITDDLEFDFLPSFEGFFHQNLWGKG